MRTLDFNSTAGLILNRSNTSLNMLTDLDALVSVIVQRLQFFLGEWFLDTSSGVPYFQEIFRKPVDPSLVVLILNNEITKEPTVQSVNDASFDYDVSQRTFSYSATVSTTYGSATINTGTV